MKIDKRLRHAKHCKIVKESGGQWSMVKEALTKDDVHHHFTNGKKYGVPFIRQGEDCTMLAMIDLDDHDGSVGWERIVDEATRISDALATRGLKVNPYRSGGGKGINLWLAWEQAQDAYSVREAIRSVITECGFKEGAGGVDQWEVEIFPKQTRIGADENGNCAAIPAYPLDDFVFEDGEQYEWRDSEPVPVVEAPKQVATTGAKASEGEIGEWLAHIDPVGMGYDEWNTVLMAIHEAGGTYDQALEWSERDPAYSGATGLNKRKWNSYKGEKEYKVGVGRLKVLAEAGGWSAAKVDDFPAEVVEVNYQTDKNGVKLSTIGQLVNCTLNDSTFPFQINYDQFFGEIFITYKDKTERLQDYHYTRMRVWFETQNWKPVGKDMMRDVVYSTAQVRSSDVMRSWMDTLTWDGTDRLDELVEALGLEVNPYHKAVARYILTGLAARQLDPGCQLDITPILIGGQGLGKTRCCMALAPKMIGTSTSIECSASDLIDTDRAARLARSKSVIILDELRGMKKDREAIKAAMTRRVEEHTPKYMENRVQFKRRCMLIGTTNEDEFLDDPTGARRFAPVTLTSEADPEWITENLSQLWAQGVVLFKADGVNWAEVQSMASDEHCDYQITDSWEEIVSNYLDTCLAPVTSSEILINALNFEPKGIKRGDEMRISDIMRRMGKKKIRQQIDGVRHWMWE